LKIRSFQAVLDRRFSRRALLGSIGAAGAAGVLGPLIPAAARAATAVQRVAPQRTDAIVLPRGYTWDRVAAWGDALFAAAPSMSASDLQKNALAREGAAARQARQFGANCDAVAFFPITARRSDRGILCVNNEYVASELAFGGRRRINLETAEERRAWIEKHPHAVSALIAAHGVSVLEVARQRGRWRQQVGSPFARRITAATPCEIAGPARGAPLLRTNADPTGTRALGTFANCAGGKTPWGTYLTAEENIDDYFGFAQTWAKATSDTAAMSAFRRWPLREHSYYGWDHADSRFDVRAEPHEAFRHGWIVEIDPRDPNAPPRKLTALGRFSHEGANTTLARDRRVVAYMGDDDMFEYVYKFVSRGAFDPSDPRANRRLLDHGTLYAARLDADGTGAWLPLVHDEKGPLNRRNGFANQADVLIQARAAADLLGATPMDRPEDVEPSPLTGRVYIACTKNGDREAASRKAAYMGREIDLGPNPANPRAENRTGHVVELIERDDDAAATSFRWDILVEGGGNFACPDNFGFDPQGRLWIVTDNDNRRAPNNGCFVCATAGAERGVPKQMMSGPIGAEIAGCEFTPDGTTLFLSIQHPGEGGTLDEPQSHWPDGGDLPPRATLIAVRRDDGDAL
jgi:uncharacterized protein